MRHVCALTLLMLGSCATPEYPTQPLYSPLLSAADIAEITALVTQRTDIRQPIYQITTEEDRRDRFVVYTGRWNKVGDQADYFTVRKRHGKWKIVSPIQHDTLKREQIIVTS